MTLRARVHHVSWEYPHPWRVKLHPSGVVRYFQTWEQAMHYADRMVHG